MEELDSLKLRYRCPECKNLESHRVSDKKRKCEKCGKTLTEITEKDYHHYKKKKKKEEEDKKEKKDSSKNIDKKEKKKKKEEEDSPEKEEDKKHKRKLKRSSSTKNIEDKNYKLKKENKEVGDLTSRSKSKSKEKKKKRNRYKSIEKLGPILNKIVSKVLKGGKGIEKHLKKLNKIDFSSITHSRDNNIIINHSNNQPTTIMVNDKEITNIVDTEVFEPLFNTLNKVFLNNFMENFSSSSTTYYNNVQNVVYNNRQHAIKNGSVPINDKGLAKLKNFKLSDKYCKKGKDGNYELPSCCICLSEIKKGKETTLLPCGHMFHTKCCMGWLETNNTCPMCRYEI